MATPRAPTVGGGRFVLDSRLGDGGQAAVFRVRDLKLGVTRALKIMLPRFASKAKIRARFAAEARAMAQLEHPNIVRVYDVETEAALPYLVMELVPSGSLANWLETYGSFPCQQAVEVALQICAGAAGAHAANIVHRDIKPQNVLVDANGACKLTDFGIARFEDSHHTRMGAALGTEGYMAPEQAKDASTADVRSDVYGIAMTLFVLATGNDPVEWLSGRGVDQVPPALCEVLETATAADPADRYPTANALAYALREVLSRLPPDETELPLGDALPVRSVETEDAPESYADVTVLIDGGAAESLRSSPTVDLVSLGPPPPSRGMQRTTRPTPTEGTPDYVDREAKTAAPTPFVVGLEPPEAPSVDGRSEESTERSAITQVLRFVFHPLQVVPVLVGTLLLAVAWGAYENVSAHQAVEDMRQSREQMYGEIASQRGVIDSVATLGGDRVTLEATWSAWHAARGEPDKSTAAVRFVESLEMEADRVAAPGSVSWEELNSRVRILRNARDGYTQSHQMAVSSHDSRWVFGTAE